MSFWDKETVIVFGGLAVLFAGLVALCFVASSEDDRLMKECLADGHKEYECRSMLRDNRPPPPVVIPVAVPVSR